MSVVPIQTYFHVYTHIHIYSYTTWTIPGVFFVSYMFVLKKNKKRKTLKNFFLRFNRAATNVMNARKCVNHTYVYLSIFFIPFFQRESDFICITCWTEPWHITGVENQTDIFSPKKSMFMQFYWKFYLKIKISLSLEREISKKKLVFVKAWHRRHFLC